MAAPAARRSVVDTLHVRLELDAEADMAYMTRTAKAFGSAADIDATIRALAMGLPTLLRRRYAVLIDMRQAPVGVPEALESAFARYRAETERGFRRAAVVVKTTLGEIRSKRLGESSSGLFVTSSVEQALRYLQGV